MNTNDYTMGASPFLSAFLAVACFSIVAAPRSANLSAQTSACLTNADTAATHIEVVTRIVTTTDSSTLVGQGIPYRPAAGVSLVSEAQTCQAVLNAYNALYAPADSAHHLGRAYVLGVGTMVYVLAATSGSFDDVTYVFFDSSLRWLVGMVPMR
jgi:hypothetical protein